MKQVILGSILCLSGIILYGMNLIAASIYSGYGAIKTKEFGQQMIGSFPVVLSVILVVVGLAISILGLLRKGNS